MRKSWKKLWAASLAAGATGSVSLGQSATTPVAPADSAEKPGFFERTREAFENLKRKQPAPREVGQTAEPRLPGTAKQSPPPKVVAAATETVTPFPARVPTDTDLQKPGVAGAAYLARKNAMEATERLAAIRYLGTLDCRYFPEAENALVSALRTDGNESVRHEAATVLARGCCYTKRVMEALEICVSGSDRDGHPAERSARIRSTAARALEGCLVCFTGKDASDDHSPAVAKSGPDDGSIPKFEPGEPEAPSPRMPDAKLLDRVRRTLADFRDGPVTTTTTLGTPIGRAPAGLGKGNPGPEVTVIGGTPVKPIEIVVASTPAPAPKVAPKIEATVATAPKVEPTIAPASKPVETPSVPSPTPTPKVEVAAIAPPPKPTPAPTMPTPKPTVSPAKSPSPSTASHPFLSPPTTWKIPTTVESPKMVEVPKVAESPKVVEAPKIVEAPKVVVEAPKSADSAKEPTAKLPTVEVPPLPAAKPTPASESASTLPRVETPIPTVTIPESKPLPVAKVPTVTIPETVTIAPPAPVPQPAPTTPAPVATRSPEPTPLVPHIPPATTVVPASRTETTMVPEGSTLFRELVIKLYTSPFPEDRHAAIRELVKLDPKENPSLVRALIARAKFDPSEVVRVDCIRHIVAYNLATPEVVRELDKLKSDRNEWVRTEAVKAVKELKPEK